MAVVCALTGLASLIVVVGLIVLSYLLAFGAIHGGLALGLVYLSAQSAGFGLSVATRTLLARVD